MRWSIVSLALCCQITLVLGHKISTAGSFCRGPPLRKPLLCFYGGHVPPQQMDPCLCSHLVLTGWTVNDTYNFHNDKFQGLQFTKILKAVNPNLRMLASLHEGGNNSVLTKSIADSDQALALAKAIASFVKTHSLDGIEIDWEPITPSHKEGFVRLIKMIRDALDADVSKDSLQSTLIIKVAKKFSEISQGYDFDSLNQLVDLYFFPAYNFTNSKNVVHHSRLMASDGLNADSILDLLISLNASTPKIVLGVPAFGVYYRLKNRNSTTTGSEAKGEIRAVAYREICKVLKKGWTVQREEDKTAPYAVKHETWIGYDDTNSIRIKTKYTLLRNLAGIGIWKLDGDDFNNTCGEGRFPLTRAVNGILAELNGLEQTQVLNSLAKDLDVDLQASGSELVTASSRQGGSPFRVSSIVDRTGEIHLLKDNSETDMECTRPGYYRHPVDCARFYRCVKFDQFEDDFTIFEYDCPEGLVFDDRYEVCNWPSAATPCDGSSEIFPVPKSKFVCSEVGYFTDPENCRWFYYCSDFHEDGTLTAFEFRCPFDLAFDEEKLLCNWRSQVESCGESGEGRPAGQPVPRPAPRPSHAFDPDAFGSLPATPLLPGPNTIPYGPSSPGPFPASTFGNQGTNNRRPHVSGIKGGHPHGWNGPNGPFPIGSSGPNGPFPVGSSGPNGPFPNGPQGPFTIGPSGGTGPNGPEGPVGGTGPNGGVGPTGPTGGIGPNGGVGPTGPIGGIGPTGGVGPTGPIGGIGPNGGVGPTGPIGGIGPNGGVGPTGPIGGIGPNGGVGPTGPIGGNRPNGGVGPIGPIDGIGPLGGIEPVGPSLSVGGTGPNGGVGPGGPNGPIGGTGPNGGVGPVGPNGPIGGTGPNGGVGPVGPNGPIGGTGPNGGVGPGGPNGPIGGTGPNGGVGPGGPNGPIGGTGPTRGGGSGRPNGLNRPTGNREPAANGGRGPAENGASQGSGRPNGDLGQNGVVGSTSPVGGRKPQGSSGIEPHSADGLEGPNDQDGPKDPNAPSNSLVPHTSNGQEPFIPIGRPLGPYHPTHGPVLPPTQMPTLTGVTYFPIYPNDLPREPHALSDLPPGYIPGRVVGVSNCHKDLSVNGQGGPYGAILIRDLFSQGQSNSVRPRPGHALPLLPPENAYQIGSSIVGGNFYNNDISQNSFSSGNNFNQLQSTMSGSSASSLNDDGRGYASAVAFGSNGGSASAAVYRGNSGTGGATDQTHFRAPFSTEQNVANSYGERHQHSVEGNNMNVHTSLNSHNGNGMKLVVSTQTSLFDESSSSGNYGEEGFGLSTTNPVTTTLRNVINYVTNIFYGGQQSSSQASLRSGSSSVQAPSSYSLASASASGSGTSSASAIVVNPHGSNGVQDIPASSGPVSTTNTGPPFYSTDAQLPTLTTKAETPSPGQPDYETLPYETTQAYEVEYGPTYPATAIDTEFTLPSADKSGTPAVYTAENGISSTSSSTSKKFRGEQEIQNAQVYHQGLTTQKKPQLGFSSQLLNTANTFSSANQNNLGEYSSSNRGVDFGHSHDESSSDSSQNGHLGNRAINVFKGSVNNHQEGNIFSNPDTRFGQSHYNLGSGFSSNRGVEFGHSNGESSSDFGHSRHRGAHAFKGSHQAGNSFSSTRFGHSSQNGFGGSSSNREVELGHKLGDTSLDVSQNSQSSQRGTSNRATNTLIGSVGNSQDSFSNTGSRVSHSSHSSSLELTHNSQFGSSANGHNQKGTNFRHSNQNGSTNKGINFRQSSAGGLIDRNVQFDHAQADQKHQNGSTNSAIHLTHSQQNSQEASSHNSQGNSHSSSKQSFSQNSKLVLNSLGKGGGTEASSRSLESAVGHLTLKGTGRDPSTSRGRNFAHANGRNATYVGPIACDRAGLFRSPDDCSVFYECYWDRWIEKFTLHFFECPIKLVYDNGITGCNWPIDGPPCEIRK